MKFIFSGEYKADIGAHVFPTEKYILILEKLRTEGLVRKEDIVEPRMPTREELTQTLEEEYLDDLLAVLALDPEAIRKLCPVCGSETLLCFLKPGHASSLYRL